MKRTRMTILHVALSICALPAMSVHGAEAVPGATEPPLVEVVEDVDRSLVHIAADPWVGSGFVFRGDRWVVTNRHVVEGVGLDGTVTLRPLARAEDGRMTLGSPVDGVVRSFHPVFDLAVIEILGRVPDGLRPLEAIEHDRLLPRGTEVLVHGFPATMVPTVGRGIVAAHHHDFADDDPLYLLDAASGSGSSGGPVTDRRGRLVGVATAVYDVPEELGFAWCFAIPASHVKSLFDDRGRPVLPARAVTVEELLDRLRATPGGDARIESFRDGVATILESRSDFRGLTTDLEDFVGRGQAHLVIDSRKGGRLFMSAMLDMAQAGASRGVELGLQGDEALEDAAFLAEFDARQANLQSVGMQLMERSLRRRSEVEGLEIVAGLLEAIAERAEAAVRGVDAAVRRLEPVAEGDVQAMRGTARTETIAAMADLAMLQLLLEFRTHVPELTPAERREIPRSFRAVVDRVELSMTRLERTWAGVPAPVRALLEEEEVGFGSAQEMRDLLLSDGMAVAASEMIELGPAGVLRTYRVGREAPPLVVFLAESLDGVDIDLVLESPAGVVVDTDEALDGFPVVMAEDPSSGVWRLRLVNADERSTRVRLETWEPR